MGTTAPVKPRQSIAVRMLYAVLFVVLVPLALAAWAHFAFEVFGAVTLRLSVLGTAFVVSGVAVALTGMLALWRRGGGLPMNAFPPPRFVASGIYGLVPHPIYGGFVMACAGVALWSGSAAGLWLVTPAAALGCAALVLGYELPDLRARFGAAPSAWLPAMRSGAPTLLERLRI